MEKKCSRLWAEGPLAFVYIVVNMFLVV